MEKIKSENDLNAAILAMEKKREEDLKLLKEEFHLVSNNLKPLNLIKNTFKKATESPEVKQNLLNTTLGLSSGLVLKKILVGASAGPAKTIIGTALMLGITNVLSHNPEKVEKVKNSIIGFIQTKLKRPRRQIIDITPDPTVIPYQDPEI